MPFLDGLQASLCPVPGHDGGIRSQASLQDFVPTDDALAVRVGKTFHPLYHVALKLFHTLQPFGLHSSLTIGAKLPVVLTSFVAANMDVLRGKHIEDLQQHLLQELVGTLLSWTKFPRVFAATRQAASQFGISCTGLVVMPRHLYFGNHLNVPLVGKRQDLSNILLCIVSAISFWR